MEIQITTPIVQINESEALKLLPKNVPLTVPVKPVAKPKAINKPTALIPKTIPAKPTPKETPKRIPKPTSKATPKAVVTQQAITIPAIPTSAPITVPQNLHHFVPYNLSHGVNVFPTTVTPPKQPSEPPNKKQKSRIIDLVNE